MSAPIIDPTEPVIKHPDAEVYIHLEFQHGPSSVRLQGTYRLEQLPFLAMFMAKCIEHLLRNRADEATDTKPSELESKWREFRDEIKTTNEK